MTTPDLREIQIKFTRSCLCDGHIHETATDPCFIRVDTHQGAWQMWTCHGHSSRNVWYSRPTSPNNFNRCTSDKFTAKQEGR